MIELRDLSFAYKSAHPVLSRLNENFDKGMVHALIGPSGCGKTSLLYLMAGLVSPTSGHILVDDCVPVAGRDRTAVILQDHGLFPWKTVEGNLALGLMVRGYPVPEIRTRVARILDEMGLTGHEKKYPSQLSGGEQQRLAIGRALVLDPDLLLLDEPFSSLDAMTRERLQNRLWSLKDRTTGTANDRITMLLVTHSIEEAVFLSDRIHIMGPDGSLSSMFNTTHGPDYRLTPEYFAKCVEVRCHLEKRMEEVQ